MPDPDQQLSAYRWWFYAAAIYNAIWGTLTVLFPNVYFDLIGMARPNYPALWQVVGMFVAVYAPVYWWMGRHPGRFRHFIIIAILGKTFGPLSFVLALPGGQLPVAFGWTLLTNDLVWWPAFWLYLRDITRLYGGSKALILGEYSKTAPTLPSPIIPTEVRRDYGGGGRRPEGVGLQATISVNDFDAPNNPIITDSTTTGIIKACTGSNKLSTPPLSSR